MKILKVDRWALSLIGHDALAIADDPRVIICKLHYSDVIMGVMASQITSFTIVYSTVYSGAD